jgi:hypothetical protein
VNEPQNLKEDEVTKVLQKAVSGDKVKHMVVLTVVEV